MTVGFWLQVRLWWLEKKVFCVHQFHCKRCNFPLLIFVFFAEFNTFSDHFDTVKNLLTQVQVI